jgi:hypothetical protein
MAQNGYKQFFKAARDAKKGNPQVVKNRSSFSGPKVSDLLRTMKSKRKPRKNAPVLPIVCGLGLLALAGYAYQNMDQVEKFMNKIEIRAFGLVNAA